jgi:hypothetical protein
MHIRGRKGGMTMWKCGNVANNQNPMLPIENCLLKLATLATMATLKKT